MAVELHRLLLLDGPVRLLPPHLGGEDADDDEGEEEAHVERGGEGLSRVGGAVVQAQQPGGVVADGLLRKKEKRNCTGMSHMDA